MSEQFDDLSVRVDVLAGMIDSTARRLGLTDRHLLNIEDSVTRLGEQIGALAERLERPDRWADDPLGGTPLHDMLTSDLGPPRDLVIGAYSPEPRPDAQSAATAGQQDHSDPWRFAGEDSDPPEDTGRPADA